MYEYYVQYVRLFYNLSPYHGGKYVVSAFDSFSEIKFISIKVSQDLFFVLLLAKTYIECLCSVYFFVASGGGFPPYPEILLYYTMILQCPRIIVVDAGFEPGTSAPEVWRATNEPPHLCIFTSQDRYAYLFVNDTVAV